MRLKMWTTVPAMQRVMTVWSGRARLNAPRLKMLLWRVKLALTSMVLPWLSPQSMWPATGQFRWDWDWSAQSRSPLSSALQELLGGLVPRTLKLLAMSLLSLSPSSTLSSLCSASNLLLLLRILPNHIWNLELSLTLPSKSLVKRLWQQRSKTLLQSLLQEIVIVHEYYTCIN